LFVQLNKVVKKQIKQRKFHIRNFQLLDLLS